VLGTPEVSPPPFKSGATKRIHDDDARLVLGLAILSLFVVVFGAELYGCFWRGFCTNVHDVRDTIEPFAGAVFTALGAAVGFYFADRSK